MSEWHHLYVAGTDNAADVTTQIHQAIFALMVAGAKDAAAFSRIDENRAGTHFHFTPQAKSVAVAIGASPCKTPPSHEQIGNLLFGDQTIIERLSF